MLKLDFFKDSVTFGVVTHPAILFVRFLYFGILINMN